MFRHVNVLNIITNGYVLPFISKPNLVRAPLIRSGYKALQKEQALASCIQSLVSKNAIERVENVKSLGFYSRLFLVPKPHQRWRPVIDLSRLNPFILVVQFKMETPESIRDSLIPGEWVSSIRRLPPHSHPPKLKEILKVLPQVTSVPVHLPSLWASHGPTGLYNDCKRSKADGPDKGNQTSLVPGRLAYLGPVSREAQVNTQTVVDLTQSLGWIINQEKSKLKPAQLFSLVGYEYHLDSGLVKPTKKRWLNLQDLILRLKSKHVLAARCLMSLIWLLASMEKMVPEDSSQTVPQLCVSQQSTTSQPPRLVSRSGQLQEGKNKATLWRWQRELLPLRGHQQGPSTSQSGPYLRKFGGFFHSLCETSLRLLHVPVPRPKQVI